MLVLLASAGPTKTGAPGTCECGQLVWYLRAMFSPCGAPLLLFCSPSPAILYYSSASSLLQTDNYLIDAILDVPRTRQMYMRRLRTLMDAFQATGRLQVSGWCCCGCSVLCGAEPCRGRCSVAEPACVGAHLPRRLATLHLPPLPLQQIITDMYNTIRDEAKRDAAKWQNPGGAGMAGLVGHSLLAWGPAWPSPTRSPLLLPVHPRPWPCQRMTPSHPQPLPRR